MPETTVLQLAKQIDQQVAGLLDHLTAKDSKPVIGISDLDIIHEVLGDIVGKVGTIKDEVNRREAVNVRAMAKRLGYRLEKETKKPKETFARKLINWDVLPTGEGSAITFDALFTLYSKSTKVRGAKLTKGKLRDKVGKEVDKKKISVNANKNYFYQKRTRSRSS